MITQNIYSQTDQIWPTHKINISNMHVCRQEAFCLESRADLPRGWFGKDQSGKQCGKWLLTACRLAWPWNSDVKVTPILFNHLLSFLKHNKWMETQWTEVFVQVETPGTTEENVLPGQQTTCPYLLWPQNGSINLFHLLSDGVTH